MAHEIDQTVNANGAAIYANQSAWHGLGITVDHAFTSDEALAVSGMDFLVEKRKVYYDAGLTMPLEFAKRFATVRMDTMAPLGVVGDDYEVFQTADTFKAFDEVLREHGATYEAAGILRGGAKVWLLAKLPEAWQITGAPGDVINQYFLGTTTHDGSGAIFGITTGIRVVCANTLDMAMGFMNKGAQSEVNAGRGIKVRHTASAAERLQDAKFVFQKAHERWLESIETAKRLADLKATEAMRDEALQLALDTFIGSQMVVRADGSLKVSESRLRRRVEATAKIQGNVEAEFKLVGENAWAVYNGTSEFADHGLRYRGANAAENRFNALMGGHVSAFKAELAGALVKAA